MKKNVIRILSLIMLACMCFVLTACGKDTAAPKAGKEPAEAAGEAKNLVFTTSANSNETQGRFIQKFCDLVSEKTGNSVTFTIHFGGTVCGEEEELPYVGQGSVDMAAIAHTNFADDLTYIQFPYAIVGDPETLCDYYSDMLFENEVSAPLIEEQAAENNVKLLGYMYCGRGAFVSKTEAYSLYDLAGKKFGIIIPGAWEDYGVSVVNLVPPDIYDALSRGVIEASCLSFAPAYEMSWYEVADYWMLYGDVSVGNILTLNLDTWNSLTEEEQKAFEEAAQEALAYSIDLNNEIEDGYIADLRERGCTVTFVEGDDQQFYFESDFRLNTKNAMEYAAKNGLSENMKNIVSVGAEHFGIDISDILAEY